MRMEARASGDTPTPAMNTPVPGRRVLSPKFILHFIDDRKRKSLPLNVGAVRKADSALYRKALQVWGSWQNALRAAGLNPDECRLRRSPRRCRILRALRRRFVAGETLRWSSVAHLPLAQEALRRYGTWKAVLRRACIEESDTKLAGRAWTKRSIIKVLRNYSASGRFPCWAKLPWPLRRAIYHIFGSLSMAIRAAGIRRKIRRGGRKSALAADPRTASRLPWEENAQIRSAHSNAPWTKEEILLSILWRERQALPLSYEAVTREWKGLATAGTRLFGSWPGTLQAVGINPDRIRQCRIWDRKRLLAYLQHRFAEGGNTNSVVLPRSIRQALARRWGSWADAVEELGFDPESCGAKCPQWSAEKVTSEIQRRRERGLPLHTTNPKRLSLLQAGIRFFGSWNNALKADGPEPLCVRRLSPNWGRESILAEIRRRQQLSMELRVDRISSKSVVLAGRRFFGSWGAALKAAGER